MMTRQSRTAFTLTEMLIAVAILAVVILATSSIFGTAQRVASVGEANSDLVQQASAIERRIRRDIARMSTDGFLAIQCVQVDNGINAGGAGGGRLLDPDRPQYFLDGTTPVGIRCDQMVFFANGAEPSSQFLQSFDASGQGDTYAPAEGAVSMVYLGHGVQMPIQPPRLSSDDATPYDHNRDANSIYPWTFAPNYEVRNADNGGFGGEVPIITPDAGDWVLNRQAVLLADDDMTGLGTSSVFLSANDPTEFFGTSNFGNNSIPNLFTFDNGANSLRFDPAFTSGRVDITASELDDVKRDVCFSWNELGMPINSGDQKSPLVRRSEVLDAMFEGYPRGEPTSPSMLKTDQMLTNNVLASNISDFRIDWTWSDGVGRDLEVGDGFFPGGLPGVVVNGNTQPWYGLGNPAESSGGIGQPVFAALNEDQNNIENFPNAPGGVQRYGAVFGYNRDRGFLRGGDDRPILDANNGIIYADTFATTGNNNYVYQNTYSPWPTAVRITMRLHDPRNVIEGGRVFQFVVPLPKQD